MEFKYSGMTRYLQQEPTKIPRPANAFMLYANQNRKKMAQTYPLESNKEISKRLGNSWKDLHPVEKLRYYDLAKQVDIEHKRKYPDYVYNPKEARIRKAMREASRERALGVAPMSSSRGGRRSTTTAAPPAWNFAGEDQLMMAPAAHGMRGSTGGGIIGPPMCTSSTGFPIQTPGNSPFPVQSMHYGNKHLHPAVMSHPNGSYMQPNSMGHLPQQSDLWQPYEDSLRSTPGPYVLSPQMAYPPSMPSPAVLPPAHMEKPKVEQQQLQQQQQESFMHVDDSQGSHTNENIPPNADAEKMSQSSSDPVFENKVDSIQPLMDNGNMHNSEPFVTSYAENALLQMNGFEKSKPLKQKKTIIQNNVSSLNSNSRKFTKPQCHNADSNYHREYIRKYLAKTNCYGIEIVINEGGKSQTFNYVTYNNPQVQSFDCMMTRVDVKDIILMENWKSINGDEESEPRALNLSLKKL